MSLKLSLPALVRECSRKEHPMLWLGRSACHSRGWPARQHYPTFPQSLMTTLADVLPLSEPTASIFLTTS